MNVRAILAATTVVACVTGLPACGGGGGGGATSSQFPSRGEIDTLAAAPPPAKALDDHGIDVPSWTLKGAPAEAIEVAPVADASPWGAMLGGAASARPGMVVATGAMACTAREIAAFVAEKGALPAESLRRFISARCGSVTTDVMLSSQSGTVPAAMPEAEIATRWGAQVQTMVQAGLTQGSRFAGIGFARAGDRAAIVLATTRRRAHLERAPLAAQGGAVVLRGELLEPAARVEALVTQGRYGYAECAVDPNAVLPRFAVSCPVAAGDPSAWIEVAAFPAGRILGEAVVDVQVTPGAKPDVTYTHAPAAAGAGGRDPSAMAAAVVERINGIRREAGLSAVGLSPSETRKASSLAPHYFAALGGQGDVTVADKIALGLQAGWDVEGLVREGHFTSSRADVDGPAGLVEQACASPFGRRALLDPGVRAVAVGTVAAGGALGAVISTYTLLDPSRSAEESTAVLTRLAQARAAKRLGPPAVMPQLAGLLAKAAERVQAGQSPNDAMQWLLESTAEQARGRRVRVWVSQADNVKRLDLPAELLATPALSLAVGVSHHKPDGEPWARLVVFFVSVEEAGAVNTAAIGTGARG